MKIMRHLSTTIAALLVGFITMPRAGAQSEQVPPAATTLQVRANLPDLATSRNAPRLEPALLVAPGLIGAPRQTLTVSRAALEANKALLPQTAPLNAAAEALKSQFQASLGAGVNADGLRQLLLKNPNAPEVRSMMEAVRNASRPLLEADRTRSSGMIGASSAATARARATDFNQVIPRKITLDPLPPKATNLATINCEKSRRIDELRGQIADLATDPAQRELVQLDLAGYEVGQGNWLAAKAILDALLATSSNPDVLEAVRRNLLVVDKKLEALAAPDPTQRERLELELARLHYELGHEQAARRLTRELARSAQAPQVKEDAAKLLSAEPKATQPVLPPGFAPSGQTQPNTAK